MSKKEMSIEDKILKTSLEASIPIVAKEYINIMKEGITTTEKRDLGENKLNELFGKNEYLIKILKEVKKQLPSEIKRLKKE